jgi:hypothetical protein
VRSRRRLPDFPTECGARHLLRRRSRYCPVSSGDLRFRCQWRGSR